MAYPDRQVQNLDALIAETTHPDHYLFVDMIHLFRQFNLNPFARPAEMEVARS